MRNGRSEEEFRTPRPATDGNDVASQHGVGTVDGVVRPELSVIHADVAAVDAEPARADPLVAEEHVGGQIAARSRSDGSPEQACRQADSSREECAPKECRHSRRHWSVTLHSGCAEGGMSPPIWFTIFVMVQGKAARVTGIRSEERRVGKEGRSRWGAYQGM